MVQARGDRGGDGTQPGPRVSSMACAAASCWFSTFELGTPGRPEAMHGSLECFTWASKALRKRSQQSLSTSSKRELSSLKRAGKPVCSPQVGVQAALTPPSLSGLQGNAEGAVHRQDARGRVREGELPAGVASPAWAPTRPDTRPSPDV